MNPNFIGIYFYSMDSKNRLAIPAKFRASLQGQKEIILSQGLEGCLNLYPSEAWVKLTEKLESFPLKNKVEQRAFKRMLFASASNIEFDEEGRILVPQHLVQYGQLNRDIVVIGLGEKIEIWSKALWEKYQSRQKSAFARHASSLEI